MNMDSNQTSARVAKKITGTAKHAKSVVVAIGASAGGLDALTSLLAGCNKLPSNVSFIIAQHLSPGFKSHLAELLARETKLPVKPATHNQLIKPGSVYIASPETNVEVKGKHIVLKKSDTLHRPSIDMLLTSVAASYKKAAIGIILSGTGTDGAAGIKEIKKHHGLTLVQDPHLAVYNGMPMAAINSGCTDLVLPIDKMPAAITSYVAHGKPVGTKTNQNGVNDEEFILSALRQYSGTDFSAYKASTIQRRIQKRMAVLRLNNLHAYRQYINAQPEELGALQKEFTIGVTSFFRDKEAFRYFKSKLEARIKKKAPGESIRVWVPGCSSGEEVYSIAILVHEILGDDVRNYAVQIFATDIDEKALQYGRKGVFEEHSVRDLDKRLLEKYFIRSGNSYEVVKTLRTAVLFSKHDLTNSPPFVKLDVISCRNLFIYFDQQLQDRIIPLFHYSLNPGGLLFMGKSESVKQKDLFSPISTEHKVFTRTSATSNYVPSARTYPAKLINAGKKNAPATPSIEELLKDHFYKQYEHPYVVVDEHLTMLYTHGELSPYISLQHGKMSVNVIKNTLPELQIELRAVLRKCMSSQEKTCGFTKQIKHRNRIINVRVVGVPLAQPNAAPALFKVSFEINEQGNAKNVISSDAKAAPPDMNRIAELEQELDQTRQHLQSFIGEVESANEELQLLNEELQSTNEEFQAANEELETSNEEMQSANEEMSVAYNELKEMHALLEEKENQLRFIYNNFKTVLQNARQGYILLDQHYCITAFNKEAEEICLKINRKPIKEGDSLINVTPTKFLSDLKKHLGKAWKGESSSTELLVHANKKERVWLNFQYTPIRGLHDKVTGVLLSFIDLTKEITTRKLVETNEANLKAVIENFDGYVWSIDKQGRYITLNSLLHKRMKEVYGVDVKPGDKMLDTIDPSLVKAWQRIYRKGFTGKKMRFLHERDLKGDVSYFDVSVNPITKGDEVIGLSCYSRDVTEERMRELKLHTAEKRFKSLVENSYDGIVLLSEHAKTIYATPSIKRILGYEAHELIGRDPIYLAHPDDKGRMLGFFAEIRKQPGVTKNATYRLKHKNGEWKWIRSNTTNLLHEPSIQAVVFNYEDITDTRQAHDMLFQSEVSYRALFNSSPLPKLVCDKNTLRYLEVNDKAIEHYGYSREEFLSMTAFDLRGVQYRKELNAIKQQGIGKKYRNIVTHTKKNGETIYSEVVAHTINYKGKDAFLVIANDITDNIKLQNELINEKVDKQIQITKATIAVQEKERAEVGKELHDNVNQMLTTAKLYLDTYNLDKKKSPDMLNKTAKMINDSISEIRKISKSLVPPSLGELTLKESLQELALNIRLAKKEIRLQLLGLKEDKLSEELKISIYRIVQEQFNNIIKYSEATKVTIMLKQSESRLSLKISDNGIGFDMEKKRPGIGLTNIINRATTFKGKVDIDTAPGKGCSIHINFSL